jgi:hypothetical protein
VEWGLVQVGRIERAGFGVATMGDYAFVVYTFEGRRTGQPLQSIRNQEEQAIN